MITQGAQVFSGPGTCATCHGPNGTGTALAPAFNDDVWLNIDGSYPSIVDIITKGVPQPKQSPTRMAPRGGSGINPDQIRAVAAYVWSLSNGA